MLSKQHPNTLAKCDGIGLGINTEKREKMDILNG